MKGKVENLQKELEKTYIAIVSARTVNLTSYLIKHLLLWEAGLGGAFFATHPLAGSSSSERIKARGLLILHDPRGVGEVCEFKFAKQIIITLALSS